MGAQDGTTQPNPSRFKTNSLLASPTPEDASSTGTTRSLSDSEIYGLLKSPRRRFVLWYLDDVDDPVPLGEIAEQTAAWENDVPVADVSSAERKRAYVALYQCHLPKLDEVGVVEFDENRKRVAVGPNYEVLERAILSENDSVDGASFASYYLLLAIVGFVVVAGLAAVSGGFDGMTLGVVLAVVGSFAVLAAWDCYRSTGDVRDSLATAIDRFR